MLLIGRCGRKDVTSVVAALKAHTTWWSSDQGWFNWNSRPGREIATHGVNEAESKSGLIKFYKSVGVRATEKGVRCMDIVIAHQDCLSAVDNNNSLMISFLTAIPSSYKIILCIISTSPRT